MEKIVESVNFSTSAVLLNRLGDELIKDPHTAFFELIKNSYDADAKKANGSKNIGYSCRMFK